MPPSNPKHDCASEWDPSSGSRLTSLFVSPRWWAGSGSLVVFWFVWFCFFLLWVLFAWSLTGSWSVAIVFESLALLPCSVGGVLACLALAPHWPIFYLPSADFVTRFTCFTWRKGICLAVVFLCFWLCVVWFVCLFSLFCLFLFPFCFFALHWCTAHRQQFCEQKNSQVCAVRLEDLCCVLAATPQHGG